MNFMNRRMFRTGGSASINVGDNQIYDKKTDTFYTVSPEKITQLGLLRGLNLYPIYNDPSLVKGKNVERILQEFVTEDAPFAKDFPNLQRPGEATDIGAGLQEIGRRTSNVLGPIGVKALDILNELTGKGVERSVEAGVNQFAPGLGIDGGQFIRDTFTEDYQPISKEDLARQRLRNITTGVEDFTQEINEIEALPTPTDVQAPSVVEDDVLDDLLASNITGESVTFTGDAQDLDERRRAYEASLIGRDEFGNIIDRPDDIELPPSIADQINRDLAEITPIENTVDVNKTPAQSEAENLFKFDPGKLQLSDLGMTEEEYNTAKAPEVIKEDTGIFGSDRFLDFVRNVGGQLVATGQMGEGLASGAAKAAEERTARDLLKEEADRELKKAKELLDYEASVTNLYEPMSGKDTLELNNNLETLYTDFEGGLAATGFTDYAIEIIEEAKRDNKPVGGVKGFLSKMVDKGFAFAGMGREFEELSADSKVEALTKVVKQKNLQAILGESGRTISDKDRVIIERVFGTLDAFTNVDAVLGTLQESRRGLAANNEKRKNQIVSGSAFLRKQGVDGLNFYNNQLPSLQRILGINPISSQSAIARAQFGGNAITGPVIDTSIDT